MSNNQVFVRLSGILLELSRIMELKWRWRFGSGGTPRTLIRTRLRVLTVVFGGVNYQGIEIGAVISRPALSATRMPSPTSAKASRSTENRSGA